MIWMLFILMGIYLFAVGALLKVIHDWNQKSKEIDHMKKKVEDLIEQIEEYQVLREVSH